MYFNSEQSARLKELIKKLEERTGIELVAAVTGKCDTYPEVPWKAFAMAAAVGAVAIIMLSVAWPGWNAAWSVLSSLLVIFGTGASASLLSVFWPSFGRLFLDRRRVETEIEQYARASFLEHELFRTASRTGVLLLVSLYERRVFILPDAGAAERMDHKLLQEVIDEMTPLLRRKERYEALVRGLAALEAGLLRTGPAPRKKTANELEDEVIQQKGDER